MIETGSLSVNIDVACPACLLPGGTVCGNTDKIRALAPGNIALQLIQTTVGAGKFSRFLVIASDHNAGKLTLLPLQRRFCRHPDIAESVVGKRRLKTLIAFAASYVNIPLLLYVFQERIDKGFVFVQLLRVLEDNLLPGRRMDTLHTDVSGKILAKIDNRLSLCVDKQAFGLQLHQTAHRRVGLSHQHIPVRIHRMNGFPPLQTHLGCGECGNLASPIDGLSVVEIRPAHRSVVAEQECFIGAQPEGLTALQAHIHLQQQSRIVAVLTAEAVSNFPLVPAVGDNNQNRIFPFCQKRCHVINLIFQNFVVGGKLRLQSRVRCQFPVDIKLVDSMGGHVNSGFFRHFLQRKFPIHHNCGIVGLMRLGLQIFSRVEELRILSCQKPLHTGEPLLLVYLQRIVIQSRKLVRLDKGGMPLRRGKQDCLKSLFFRSQHLPRIQSGLDVPGISLPADQRSALVSDGKSLSALHFPAVPAGLFPVFYHDPIPCLKDIMLVRYNLPGKPGALRVYIDGIHFVLTSCVSDL